MSNLAKIYNDATGKGPLARERLEKELLEVNRTIVRPIETITSGDSVTEQELTAQNKFDWLSHPRTRDMLKWIADEIKTCETAAKNMSTNIHLTNDKFDIKTQIAMCLMRASNLEQVLTKFNH